MDEIDVNKVIEELRADPISKAFLERAMYKVALGSAADKVRYLTAMQAPDVEAER